MPATQQFYRLLRIQLVVNCILYDYCKTMTWLQS
jgi:hypothetical protein